MCRKNQNHEMVFRQGTMTLGFLLSTSEAGVVPRTHMCQYNEVRFSTLMERAGVMTALRTPGGAVFPPAFEERVPDNAKQVRVVETPREWGGRRVLTARAAWWRFLLLACAC